MKIQPATSHWFSEQGVRLDASYHLSEGRIAKIKVEKCPFPVGKINDVSLDVFYGGRAKRNYVHDEIHGIPFMGSSDMLKSDFTSLKFISKKYTKDIKNAFLEKGWTLISRSGTIGNTVYVNDNFTGKAASEHIIRVVPDNTCIYSGYLYAYLTSKFGYALLTQGTFGAVIQHIEPHHIKDLPIPLLPEAEQEAIHAMIEEAAQLRVEANRLLEEAVNKIEADYFRDYEAPTKFIVKSNMLLEGDLYTNEKRLEADHYRTDVTALREFLQRNFKSDFLGNLSIEIFNSGLRERKFVADGIPLFTGQSLGLLNPDYGKYLSRKLTKNITKNTTQDEDVIISSLGTIGNVELAYKNFYTNVFMSQQTSRVRLDRSKIHPGFVYLFLKSKAGQKQLFKYKTGSVIEWIRTNNIASVIVPIPDDCGQGLGEVAYEVCVKRQKAYELETAAIGQVEEWIEAW